MKIRGFCVEIISFVLLFVSVYALEARAFNGAADASGDNKTTFAEFVDYVQENAVEMSRRSENPNLCYKPQTTVSYQASASLISLETPGNGNVAADAVPVNSRIDRFAAAMVDPTAARGSPGLVVGVVGRNFSSVYGYGQIATGNQQKPDKNTLFGIGSVSKLFTGICLASAVCDGSTKLHEAVGSYLGPDLRLNDQITFRHLITHYGGLPTFPANMRVFRDLDRDGQNDATPAEPAKNYTRALLAKFLDRQAGRFVPGQSYNYSNLGVALAALALQNKFNCGDFDTLVQKVIAQPLGLKNTGTNCREFFSRSHNDTARGYYVDPAGRIHETGFADMGVLEGSGELISNAADLMLLLEGLAGIAESPLDKAFVEAMQPLAKQNANKQIGYAIDILPAGNNRFRYSKVGTTAGFTAYLCWQREPAAGMVVLANRGHCDMKLVPAAKQLFAEIAGELPDK